MGPIILMALEKHRMNLTGKSPTLGRCACQYFEMRRIVAVLPYITSSA